MQLLPRSLIPRSRYLIGIILIAVCLRVRAQTTTPALPATAPTVSAPVTQPTSAPVAGAIPALIDQLGDDDSDQRDSAQKQLVDLGPAAIADLKTAADNNSDPEIRTRAAAALAQIKQLDESGPSLITLHLKDAAPIDVLSAISAQSHAVFLGAGTGGIPLTVTSLTIDADRKPFWDVMSDLCTQMNVGPVMQLPTRNAIQLFPSARNWMSQSPHQIVGPYWINVVGLYRSRTIDLMGPPRTDDEFIIKLMLLPEPKLVVTEMSELAIKQATDNAGNSLRSKLPFNPAFREARMMNHTVQARLVYPEKPGTKISLIRGEVTLLLAQDFYRFQVDNVLTAPKVTAPLPGCRVQATVTREGADMFRVSLQCARDGISDAQWSAMISHLGDINLEDARGTALTGFPVSVLMTGTVPQTNFTATAMFSRTSINGLGPQGARKLALAGDPEKLTWNLASSVKPVVVPVVFKDLPMP
jgi:hypothetical protein